jgi:hypothetical protein
MISPLALKIKGLFAILQALSHGAILILLKKMYAALEIKVKLARIIWKVGISLLMDMQ